MKSPQKRTAPQFDLRGRQGFSQAYDYYASRIYRYILIRTSSRQDAEDLVSRAFLKMLEYVKSGKRIRNPGAFLYKTADHLVIDFYRTRASLQAKTAELGDDVFDPVAPDSLQDKIASREDVRQALNFLNALPDYERRLLVLRFVEELTLDEMTKILMKSKGAISVAIHRALKNLREVIVSSARIPPREMGEALSHGADELRLTKQ
jgi:RNA polymerase sigma-70 factor (ECF subfamily)